MLKSSLALFWLASFGYAAATAVTFIVFVKLKPRWEKAGTIAAGLGVGAHGLALALQWLASGHGPYMSRHEIISANIFIAVVFYFLLRRRRPELKGINIVLYPTVLIGMGFAALFAPELKLLLPSMRSAWLAVHVLFAKLTVGSICIAFVMACPVLVRRRPEWYAEHRLPPPAALIESACRFVFLGLLCLAMMIAAGAIWAEQLWGRYWGFDPVETGSLCVLVAYALVLHIRKAWRISPRTAAGLIVIAFLVSILFFFIFPVIRAGLHSGYFI